MLLSDDPFDRELRAQVAPPDWINPEPRQLYDLVVLGGGTAGLVAAAGAAGLGGRVALIERGLLGGDCLNYGCVPSKALLRAAKAVGEIRAAAEMGVTVPGPARADFGAVMERMRRLRAQLARHDGAARFRELGVDVFLGAGRFVSRDRAAVGGVELRFRRALIASGGRPVVPPAPGLEAAGFLTNETVFTLTELPRRLVVIGAGPAGVELAQAFARFGAAVCVVSREPRLLPRDDPEAAGLLAAALQRDGVRLELGAALERVELLGGAKRVHFRRGEQAGFADCDALLLAAGRRANVAGLGLEAAGVGLDGGHVAVDDHLRSANPRIYAAGDVVGSWRFTHAADAMARLVLRNAFFFGRRKLSALTVPWCTYTTPEVAHVGLYADQEERAGAALAELRVDFAEVDRALLDGEAEGFAKLIYERRSGRLRGATVAAARAGELLGEACLAIGKRLKAGDLAAVIHPYPTQSAAWARLGDRFLRGKLTPGAALLLRVLLRLPR